MVRITERSSNTVDPDTRIYLDALFAARDESMRVYVEALVKGYDARITVLERMSNHIHRNMLSEDRAQNIFRAEVVKTNARTRMAVALIAGIALVGNGAQNVLANHDAMSLQMRCEQGAAKAVQKVSDAAVLERHAIADETARRVLQLRDQQIDTIH